MARKECRVDAEQTGSLERETRQSSTSASRYIAKYGYSTAEQRKIREPNPGRDPSSPRQPRTPPRPPPQSPSPRRTPEPARSSGYHHGSTPPWREREERRQRSETPPSRRTRSRSRTHNRSTQGAFWTNTGRHSRWDVPDVPEPPAPPLIRQTSAQWLNSGAWQNDPAPPTNRNSGGDYFQPSYFRQNPNNSSVAYMPGYQVPYDRWIQNRDGTWLDLVPQTPDQSIYFNQPSWQRRQNELWLYGYTCTMGR